MTNILNDSLQEALKATGLRELPKALNPNSNTVWITAIVKVNKMVGVDNYCLASNDGTGGVKITRDFGPSFIIRSVDSIHPVESLEKRFQPNLRGDRQIIGFLSRNGYDAEEIAALLDKEKHETDESLEADRAKVRTYINKVALKLAQQTLADEAKYHQDGRLKSRFDNDGE